MIKIAAIKVPIIESSQPSLFSTLLIHSVIYKFRSSCKVILLSNKEKPLFNDRLFRLREIPIRTEKNWVSRMQGSYLKGKLEEDVRTGAESSIHETNPMPGLAYGLEFGKSKPNKITF